MRSGTCSLLIFPRHQGITRIQNPDSSCHSVSFLHERRARPSRYPKVRLIYEVVSTSLPISIETLAYSVSRTLQMRSFTLVLLHRLLFRPSPQSLLPIKHSSMLVMDLQTDAVLEVLNGDLQDAESIDVGFISYCLNIKAHYFHRSN